MIIYEITATADPDLIEEFETFMRETHIPDLLQTGHFAGAEMALISEGKYRIRYRTQNRETLDKYFAADAENLRADFVKNFPVGVSVSREILEVLQTWEKG